MPDTYRSFVLLLQNAHSRRRRVLWWKAPGNPGNTRETLSEWTMNASKQGDPLEIVIFCWLELLRWHACRTKLPKSFKFQTKSETKSSKNASNVVSPVQLPRNVSTGRPSQFAPAIANTISKLSSTTRIWRHGHAEDVPTCRSWRAPGWENPSTIWVAAKLPPVKDLIMGKQHRREHRAAAEPMTSRSSGPFLFRD